MNFATLCDFLEELRAAKGVSEKSKLAKAFIRKARDEKHDIFTILRLVVPKLDRDRPSYKIKESKISKLLIKMLGLPSGNDKNLLLKSISGSSIDFGDVIYSVLKKYIVNKEIGMTVSEVNTYLDKIAKRTSDNGLDDLILEIFRKLSANNTKWFIQIILKDLKLGMGDNSILNCFHEDAANFYASNNNLKKVCEVLKNPQIKLHELEIQIFEPFRPMLSKRCDASNFKKCFPDSKLFVIENKFDGERFQLHMQNWRFKYFSRNGYDYTNTYGASFDEGSFTPFLKNVFSSDTQQIILDGEMMLWNKNTQNFGSKGMNLDVKKLSKGKYQACFCVFDILLYNEKILTNQPLFKRQQILKDIIKKPVKGTLILSEYTDGQSREDIVNALNSSVDNNEEGIVVKDPKSVYKFSDRNSGWFKIKMEYFDDVVHDLDVIIMGGSFGASNKMNSFIVGVLSGDTYLSLGSISSGLNYEQLDLLNDKLKTDGVDFKLFSTKSQGKLLFGKETPDIYIESQNSCILQIRASELIRTTSDHVKCPYTLRFPRVLRIRHDKPVEDCLTMNELLELTGQNKSVIKLNKRHIELSEIICKSRPQKKIKLEVVNLVQPQEVGYCLSGKKIYVHSGGENWGVEEIYHCVKKAGGEVAYRIEPDVDIVLAGKFNPKLLNLLQENGSFDVVHVDWLKRVLELGEIVDYKQHEVFKIGANFRRDLSRNFDKFGDDFVEESSRSSLEYTFKLMEQNDDFLNVNEALVSEPKYQLFAEYVAYFDSFAEINNPNSEQIYYSFPDQMRFEYYKGTVSTEITSQVNLIIIREDCDKRKALIRHFLKDSSLGFLGGFIKIVSKDFLYQS